MRFRTSLSIIVVGALIAWRPVAAQNDAGPPLNMSQAFARAVSAAGRGDLRGAIALLGTADSIAPGNPDVLFALARLEARAGDAAGALRALDRLMSVGVARDLTRDSAFASLRDPSRHDRATADRFADIAQRLATAAKPLIRSDTALVINDPDLIPESVAYDPLERTFYLGSLARRAIVRVDGKGTGTTLVASGANGLGRVLGIRMEPRSNRLWVANWVPDSAAPHTDQGAPGWAQVHVYEVPSGRLVRRFTLRDNTTAHLLNDMAFAPSGDVYLSDSYGAAVFRVRAGSEAIEQFYDGAPKLVYPNGIAISADGRAVYLAHTEGLTRIDLRTRVATPVAVPVGVFAGAIDGMYTCGRDLIGVQGVVDYDRVVRLRLDAAGTHVLSTEVLERRHPAYDAPTTGVMMRTVTGAESLVYIASSHLRRLNDDGTLAPGNGAPTVLLRLRLGACR